MTKMTIDIPDERYKSLKHSAVELGVSIKDYVLDALNLKEEIMIRDDGVVRRLRPATIKALKESRSGKKLKSFKSVEALMRDLNN